MANVSLARRRAIDAGHDARWKKPEHVCMWKCPVVDEIDAYADAIRADEREKVSRLLKERDYLIEVLEQIHVDTHDALAALKAEEGE